jgi:hypothetical protein
MDCLGYIEHQTGDDSGAIRYYRQAVTLFSNLGNTYEGADTLDRLGHPHVALGQHNHARTVWLEALQLYREQQRDDAERVQRQLHELEHTDDISAGARLVLLALHGGDRFSDCGGVTGVLFGKSGSLGGQDYGY